MALKTISMQILPGADGSLRTFDPYGLMGNGISEEELKGEAHRRLANEVEEQAKAGGWTMRETREILLREIKTRKERNEQPFELLLQAEIIQEGAKIPDGKIITASAEAWHAINDAIAKDPSALEYFARHPRKFEEFIAGAYDAAGWDEVTLTPSSGDGGRDVIAVKKGFGSIRILEQTKAYKPGHLVTHNDVRALLGVLNLDTNSSKGIITTTSDFQPGILTGPEFKKVVPYRLELKNGTELSAWLANIKDRR